MYLVLVASIILLRELMNLLVEILLSTFLNYNTKMAVDFTIFQVNFTKFKLLLILSKERGQRINLFF